MELYKHALEMGFSDSISMVEGEDSISINQLRQLVNQQSPSVCPDLNAAQEPTRCGPCPE